MNELSNRDLQLALNRVCFSQDFRFFFISKHHYCPDGMTLVVEGDPLGETQEAKKHFSLSLLIRHYGYDSLSNKGTSICDDLQDYYPGKFDFTSDHLDTVLEYFKTNKPELYEKYMDGVQFYLGRKS